MRRSVGPGLRFRVLERGNFRCHYCGASSRDTTLEVDHVVPVSHGGTNDISNLVAACFGCNRGKRNRNLSSQTFIGWLRLQVGRNDLVGDLADDEARTPLGEVRTYWDLRRALFRAQACYDARVAGYCAWREYQRGKPVAIVREQQEHHERRLRFPDPDGIYWTKQGPFKNGKKLW